MKGGAAVNAAVDSAGGMLGKKLSDLQAGIVSKEDVKTAAYGAASLVGGVTAKVAGIGLGRAANANTTTEFTGVGIRTFSFSYNLMPASKEDSIQIAKIIQTFRENLYPEKTAAGFALIYPPTWSIRFEPHPGSFPKITQCYLNSFTATFNGQGNAWHAGAAPASTDIQFSFTETKTLTKTEIKQQNGTETKK
jgi:hypothetical protein